jgi:DNA-binding FrmR family transcriptional regulator
MNKVSDTDARINRLIGQIEGIRRMVNSKRKAEDTVQQIMAARQALARLGLIVIKRELVEVSGKNTKKIENLLEKIFRV